MSEGKFVPCIDGGRIAVDSIVGLADPVKTEAGTYYVTAYGAQRGYSLGDIGPFNTKDEAQDWITGNFPLDPNWKH